MKTKFIVFCVLFSVCISVSITAKAQAVNVQDSLALVDLYNSTNGSEWYTNANWLQGPVETWYGVFVSNTRVTAIYLNSNNLQGSIPTSIGDMENLYDLWLSRNQLYGSIPPEMGNLVNLYDLYIDNNKLTGVIPVQLGNMVSLGELSLSNNQLTGTIPTELSNNKNLGFLFLNNNNLSGSIPPELGNLTKLGYLYLNNNELTGSIPKEIGKLTNLGEFYLNDNHLTGVIPTELGKIENLQYLYLNNNRLSGSIPSELGALLYLSELNISNNILNGNIPSSLTNLPLYILNLSHNRFDFDGMEQIAQRFSFAVYDHQKRIPVHLHNNTLSVSAGGTLSNNSYHWFKVGESGYTTVAGDSVFHPSQSGTYYARICNSVVTGLILKTDTITYTVGEPISQNNIISYENAMQSNNKNKLFTVYPIPAKDILHVQTNILASLSLIDQSGKILITTNIDGNGIINISKIATGTYYLRNKSNGEVKTIVVAR